MRNLLGGLVGALLGAFIISILFSSAPNSYPAPFNVIWFLFDGSQILESTIDKILTGTQILEIVFVWLVIGIIISPFSKNESNTIRTVLWLGLVLGSLLVASILITDSGFWSNPDRNAILLVLYLRVILSSLFSLISAIPFVLMIRKIKRKEIAAAPTKIETTCECGAVYKSRPMICAKCGRRLDSSTPTTDASS